MSSTFRPRAVDDLVRELAIDIRDRRVLEAVREVPRERFVPPELRACAYENEPLPIAAGQTISQPLIVAMMSAALALTGSERVLEIGTGSGYQAAVLARLAREVVSVEVHDVLRQGAERVLRDLGVTNVLCRTADDGLGAPDLAPFEAIIVTAAAPRVPPSLLAQLAEGGRLSGAGREPRGAGVAGRYQAGGRSHRGAFVGRLPVCATGGARRVHRR